jgi:hypothetical protein
MKQQLLFFRQQTNYKPERIIFFRDGVSEGQFAQVTLWTLTWSIEINTHGRTL